MKELIFGILVGTVGIWICNRIEEWIFRGKDKGEKDED